MPRRDGEVFRFGTAIGSNSSKGAEYRFEAGLIEEGKAQS
jgi:hypothetical protein